MAQDERENPEQVDPLEAYLDSPSNMASYLRNAHQPAEVKASEVAAKHRHQFATGAQGAPATRPVLPLVQRVDHLEATLDKHAQALSEAFVRLTELQGNLNHLRELSGL